MSNALSLRPGDRVPDFALPGLDGKLRKFIWSFTGAPVALLAIDDLRNLDAEHFTTFLARAKEASVAAVVVAGNPVAAAAAPWAKLVGADGPLLLCDPERRFLGGLLAQGGIGYGQAGGLRMRVIVLDPNQRVAATFDTRPLLAATEALAGLAEQVQSSGGSGQVIGSPMAPVLVLPRVFEPEFCRQVMRLWEKGDHKDSGVSSRYGNVGVAELKRTEDYMVVEPVMQKAISDRLAHRIGPELIKVFAFDREFTFDAHVVLSYSADGRHFFGAHRDNGAPTTADRAFAVSLNLNDDYDGGELVFPEYAAVKVKPPVGAAAVFSCSVLHEALPVTRGRRFVLTTFFRAKKALLALLPALLLAFAAPDGQAQDVSFAHMEGCLVWSAQGTIGARNECSRPIAVKFMTLEDQRIVAADVAPGGRFETDAPWNEAGFIFTACPVGYMPSLRFAIENKEAIRVSLYNCLPGRPNA